MRATSSPFPRTRSVILLTLLATAACVASLAQSRQAALADAPRPLISQPVDENQLTTLRGNTYPLARPEFDLGTAPASLPMERMLLVLKRSPEQEYALKQLLDDQQNKTSPNYHKWLTPEEFGQQFGPTDTDVQTITGWLQSHGFQVGSTRGRTVLEFSGSASQVQEAFHTTIHKYLVHGEQHWANSSDPSIPTVLTPAVAGVLSLHNFQKQPMNRFVGRYSEKTRALTAPAPNFTFTCGSGFECYAVTPYDFATIYDVLPLWNGSPAINGAGQTIAIVGRTNIKATDATTFWSLFGLTVPANKLNIIVNGLDPGINGDEPEADIDVQWSGAVAPQATIDFVTSQSTESTDGVDLSALYIVDNNLAPVMSESYGQCELFLGTAGNQFFYSLWGQAAAQGISVFISSGDNGSAGCDNPSTPAQFGLSVNGIASTPFNAAIGGTDFNQYNTWTTYWNSTNDPSTQKSAKGYILETTWNDSCTNALAITLGYGSTAEQACNNPSMIAAGGVISTGGSGGPSSCVVNTQGVVGSCTQGYAKPSWQVASGVPADSKRDLPDVSLFASNGFLNSFYVICETDVTGICDLNNFLGYGGTSVSSPAFAGIMSLVNQKMGSPQGVPGFALYKLLSKQPNAFHDVPSGSTIAMPCVSGTPNCTPSITTDYYAVLSGYSTGTGYDLATGLGTVDAANLVNNWSKATFTATTSTLKLNNGSAVSVTHGTAVPVSIDVTPTAATGIASLLVSNTSGTTVGQAIDGFALSGGSVSGSTSMLPGGSYSVIAHYGGDGTYGGSYSITVPVTVSPENGTVVPTLLPSGTTTTVAYDSEYWLRVDVQNSKGQFCTSPGLGEVACPTGTITITDGANPFGAGSYKLNSEGYTETVNQLVALTGGTHTLTSQYSGDSSYNANSGSVVITVNKAPTGAQQPYFQAIDYTQPVTMSTAVWDGNAIPGLDAAPTGQVTFYSNGTAIAGTPSYSSSGVTLTASLTTTFSNPGTYTITATYGGDQNYQGSTSPASQLVLTYPMPVTSLGPDGQIVQSGGNATLTALADTTNQTVYPTGTVTLLNFNTGASLAGPTSCTNAKDNSGNYACQVVFTFAPTATLLAYARYSGDSNYPASSSPTVTVNVPDFSISPGSSQVTVTQGQSQPVTINVGAISGFSGTVSNFTVSGLPAEAVGSFSPTSVSGSGSTTLTITTQPLGQFRKRTFAGNHGPWWPAGGAVLIGVCLLGVPGRRRRTWVVSLICVALIVLPGCGGNSSGGPPPNPVPSISSLSPNEMAAGSAGQALTINGTGFVSSSSATFNGSARTATYLSSTQLTIPLSNSDLAATGTFPVVITNPAPGGGASSPSNFNVVTGTPTGSFSVTVTATSGSIMHNTTFTLIVQ